MYFDLAKCEILDVHKLGESDIDLKDQMEILYQQWYKK